MLSALIPVLAIAILSLRQVNDALVRQNHTHLNQSAKDFGAGLFGRLQLLDQYLQTIAANPVPEAVSDPDIQSRIAAVTIIGMSGERHADLFHRISAVPELNNDARMRLAAGGALVLGNSKSDQGAGVLLVRPVDSSQKPGKFVVAEIDPKYLWGDADTFAYLTNFCVLRGASSVLFCSKPLATTAIEQWSKKSAKSSTGTLSWHDGENQIGGYWSLFLKAEFHEDDWTIIASMPESEAFGALTAFRQSFLPIICVSILAACLLGATQIRRTMVPLEKLIAGTRRLAAKEFGQPVVVGRNDEFGELADAFNGMATRLGQQFNALAAFSEIDRAVLARFQADKAVEMMLSRLPQVVRVDVASITVMDTDSTSTGKTYTQSFGASPAFESQRVMLNPLDLEALARERNGVWSTIGLDRRVRLGSLEQFGARHVLTLPIVWDQQLCGMLNLAYVAQPVLTEEEQGHVRDLADRLAVALSAAARDALLYKQAHFDSLTSLPNRMLFIDRLGQEIVHAERDESKLAVLFIDLDRFKTVNDTLGHASGDVLLQQAASRLQAVIRKSDTLARLGGDEFTVVLPKLTTLRDAEIVVTQMLHSLSEPFEIAGLPHFLGASIGIAIYPVDGKTSGDLLKNADTAMYRAKGAGGGTHAYFEERMNKEAATRLSLERELRRAIENNEFVVEYQPQWDLRHEKLCGAEALVRWNHPERGLLSPAHFIACAEETGLIETIGAVVLEKSCEYYQQLHLKGIALDRVSVNVSGRQFAQSDFVDTVALVIKKYRIKPGGLELEVTESMVMDDITRVEHSLTRLRSMGVRVAIDDFGTGYSSMAYLKRLPVDVVKIDRSFVIDLTTDNDSQAIVQAIIAMGHTLHKEIIAEGVETIEQREILRAQGCDQIQGYLYSRPLAADKFAAFAAQQLANSKSAQQPA